MYQQQRQPQRYRCRHTNNKPIFSAFGAFYFRSVIWYLPKSRYRTPAPTHILCQRTSLPTHTTIFWFFSVHASIFRPINEPKRVLSNWCELASGRNLFDFPLWCLFSSLMSLNLSLMAFSWHFLSIGIHSAFGPRRNRLANRFYILSSLSEVLDDIDTTRAPLEYEQNNNKQLVEIFQGA